MAAAVHEEHDYVIIEKQDEGVGDLVRFIIAKGRLVAVFGEDGYEVVNEMKGADLIGKSRETNYMGKLFFCQRVLLSFFIDRFSFFVGRFLRKRG